jgi:NAD(P)-dependent dehydrogenase (short-subunit alcohol dehydrogenase family)
MQGMSDSTALVTGATGGIGLHIARGLAEQGWTVLVGARDATRGAEVAARVTETDVEVFRRTYETNVFGVVAVTNAFLPALRRSAHPRIVNVSSGTGSLTWSTGPNPQFDYQAAGTGSGAAYRSSKTSLDALTVFYAQALADDRFKVNALAPGLRATNLNPRAAQAGGDPAEAAAGAIRLALLPDDGPTGRLFSWDGTVVPW